MKTTMPINEISTAAANAAHDEPSPENNRKPASAEFNKVDRQAGEDQGMKRLRVRRLNKGVSCSIHAHDFRPLQWNRTKLTLVGVVLAVLFGAQHRTFAAEGPASVNLGSAAHFTILAGAAITTTGGGIIHGDIGASPITGAAIHLTDAQVNGTIYAVDAAGPAGSVIDPTLLTTAKGDLTTAYNEARDRTPVPSGPFLNPGAGNIGGMNLIPGLYKFDATASITGSDLTLTGGPDDVWIFQIGADLQVGSTIHVILAGGAQPRNIFWQVGTSAVIGTFAVFKGTIMAAQAITMNTSSTMDGRALAFTAGVTYNGDSGSLPTLEAPFFTDISRTPSSVTVVIRTTPYFLLTLETSPDLVNWKTLTTATPITSTWTFTDDDAMATGTRLFYRAFLSAY